MSEQLVIDTRASRLALWQAEYVQGKLQLLYPQMTVELLKLSTRGDEILDRSLSKVGGKGLFVKELETALLDGRADLAVHSLKDVPVDLQASFSLSTILARADCRDAFVSNRYDALSALPAGAVVGTSSLRREAQLRARFPLLHIEPLRGNLDTRLAKLDNNQYDAIILAAAGLDRLQLSHRIRSYIEVEQSLPAAGQGALGLEILASSDKLRRLLQPLVCETTTACAIAERTVSKMLGGSCQVPLAAYAQIESGELNLQALVAMPTGLCIYRAQAKGHPHDAVELGKKVANELIAQGADKILAALSEPVL